MTMYDSWRNKMSRIIGRCLFQEAEVCWAIALIRQFEALSKIDKSLDLDQALSIQELINNIPKQFIEDDGTLLDMVHAKDPLWTYGTVLEHVCPLTYALNITGSSPEPAVRYWIKKMNIHYLDTYMDDYKDFGEVCFEETIERLLTISPLAARIPMCWSSYESTETGQIYDPTPDEIAEAKENKYGHYMLLTGHGIDENNIPYWEFQDTKGNTWGDEGFVRVRRQVNLVTEFVEIKL